MLGEAATSQTSLLHVTIVVLAACLVLGGGTRPGHTGDVLLQLFSVPFLILFISALFPTIAPASVSLAGAELRSEQLRSARLAALVCGLVCLWPLLQLVPLPPAIWRLLPDRDHFVRSFELLAQPLPWLPVSMVAQATWAGWLSLMPPVTVFLGTLLLGYQGRRRLSLALLAIGLAHVVLGLTQVAQGPGSSLRFYEVTNALDAVGFFANRNHYAALLYCLTVFAVVWAIDCAVTAKAQDKTLAPAVLTMIGVFTVLVVLIGAQAMARSRAGIGLSIAALAGAFLLAMVDGRARSTPSGLRLLVAATALGVMFSLQFALYRVMERFTTDTLADWRLIFTKRTYAAAIEHVFVGTGIGTFIPVYSLYERTEDLLPNTYANHAHNDLVQLLLEAGAPGAILMCGIAVWLAYQIVQCWRPVPVGMTDVDQGLRRAATIVVALLALHSFVDYPLRTGAMMAVMAFALGLLVPPPVGVDPPATETVASRSRTSRQSAPRTVGAVGRKPNPADYEWPVATEAARRSGPTGPAAAIEWPKEWQRSGAANAGSGTSADPGPAPTPAPAGWPTPKTSKPPDADQA